MVHSSCYPTPHIYCDHVLQSPWLPDDLGTVLPCPTQPCYPYPGVPIPWPPTLSFTEIIFSLLAASNASPHVSIPIFFFADPAGSHIIWPMHYGVGWRGGVRRGEWRWLAWGTTRYDQIVFHPPTRLRLSRCHGYQPLRLLHFPLRQNTKIPAQKYDESPPLMNYPWFIFLTPMFTAPM